MDGYWMIMDGYWMVTAGYGWLLVISGWLRVIPVFSTNVSRIADRDISSYYNADLPH